jgi:diguanylate cyclase (GGDEF)-like protein
MPPPHCLHARFCNNDPMAQFIIDRPFSDARLEELRLLSWVADAGTWVVDGLPQGPWGDLLQFLVWNDFLTGFSYQDAVKHWTADDSALPRMITHGGLVDSRGMPGDSLLERSVNLARLKAAEKLLQCVPVEQRLTHWGRVRLSELKQALRTGREREPFGILWDGRHWEQDLQIAVLDAKEDAPLSVAFLDMNGLKQVNDTFGHSAGDAALKTYMQAVAATIGDQAQGYRLSGDEVLVSLPGRDIETASRLMQAACRKLMDERLEFVGQGGERPLLSISVGITTTRDRRGSPLSIRSEADEAQYRAKARSKKSEPRPSVIAANGEQDMIVLSHEAAQA